MTTTHDDAERAEQLADCDGCETCRRWHYGTGRMCLEHDAEAVGYTDADDEPIAFERIPRAEIADDAPDPELDEALAELRTDPEAVRRMFEDFGWGVTR